MDDSRRALNPAFSPLRPELSNTVDADTEPPKGLCIGPDPAGNLLEILYLELDHIELVIHAMPLRPVFRAHLTGDDK